MKLYVKIEKKLLNSFWINGKNMAKCVKNAKIWPFRFFKRTIIERSSKPVFWQFISTLIGQLYAKIEKKLLNSFGANGPQVQKGPNLTFLTLKNDLERFNQIYPSICDLCHPKEAPCQKRENSYWSVSEIDPSTPPPLPLNLDGWTDGQMDDGQLGTRKAPLPFG